MVKAFSVLEHGEYTGGIVFAKSGIAARRLGANEYADGDSSYVDCRRAAWADKYADSGVVPVGVMIARGWHFECAGCGHRVDLDYLDERDIYLEDVQGTQNSMVFCTPLCEAQHELHRAEAKHRETRWIRRFQKIIKRRFPDAEIVKDDGSMRPHAYASKSRDGVWRIEQIAVDFNWPGMKIGPATLRIGMHTDWTVRPSVTRRTKPHWTCCSGDREAFEAYAKSSTPPTNKDEVR